MASARSPGRPYRRPEDKYAQIASGDPQGAIVGIVSRSDAGDQPRRDSKRVTSL